MLSQAHRRSIHTSLEPILGEEETDALMSELPASESDMPATKTDLVLFRRDMDAGFDQLRIEMHKGFTRIAMFTVSAVIGGMGLAAAIAASVAQAVGGG